MTYVVYTHVMVNEMELSKEERTGESIFAKSSGFDGFRDMIKLYTTGGNKINDYDIDRVELCPFAFPKNILSDIQGETTTSWTGFGARRL